MHFRALYPSSCDTRYIHTLDAFGRETVMFGNARDAEYLVRAFLAEKKRTLP